MNRLSLRKISFFIFTLLLLFALVFGYSAINLSNQFSEIEKLWSEYKSQNNEKARLHSNLYETLGYEGMIHKFKNYVLRKDFKTFVELERSIGASQSIIYRYLAITESKADKLALSDILSVLSDYQEKLEVVRSEIAKNSSSEVIDSLVAVDDERALRGLKMLSDEIMSQHEFYEVRGNKSVLIKAIKAEMGYGGMVHAFKNYVIRKDEKYKEIALSSIATIEKLIREYQMLNTTAAEKTSVYDISKTVKIYKKNIELISKGIEDNLTPEEIDANVKIDNYYALRGIQVLDQGVIYQIDTKSDALTSQLVNVSRKERENAFVVVFSTVFLAFSIFMIFTFVIINPVKNISDVMYEMARGNLDAFPDKNNNTSVKEDNEIGNMEKSLQVFKENEVKRRKAENEIRELALKDSLTGLANRNQFKNRFSEMLSSARLEDKSLTFLAIDLDDFKPVNDVYGHAAGDLILKAVAKSMQSTFRNTDLISRMGGDEFSVIMYGASDIAGVIETVERLIAVASLPVKFGKDEISVGLSIGIAQYNHSQIEATKGEESNSLDLIMQYADEALYKAKDKGKNTYCVYGSA